MHKAFAERFRRLLGINSDQALPLLRVIQAGKGLGGSVNTFFRDQVLDAPATLAAADDVVEEFSNLMSIRQRLEDVRQQRDQLAPVPGLNKEYAQSLLDANRLRELAGEEFDAYKQQLAVTVHEKTLVRYKDLAQAKAKELAAERAVRDGLAKDLRQLEADYNNQGGNAISAIEQSLENARVGLKLRQQVEEAARQALAEAGLDLEWTAEGWEQAHTHAAARSAELQDDSEALKELRFEAFDGHATKKRELAAAQQELVSLKTRKSLLPPSSIENRTRDRRGHRRARRADAVRRRAHRPRRGGGAVAAGRRARAAEPGHHAAGSRRTLRRRHPLPQRQLRPRCTPRR